ncbi:MAG: type IV pilus assembly protein PilM [Phycisphaerae bacterium]|nr:type IV pilus assembly protein PilM [Phycisphaerae bacterium]MDD5381027.1 type IV pilus assembly protein PilM [Phycisphaerae bacterium]
MAGEYNSVWAIDIGNNSLKALRLRNEGGVVEVIGFDNIQHGKVLTGSGMKPEERDELIALSLRQFVKQNGLGKDDIVVSVPSQNSFARFVKLPPVEQKRIPEIVKFEAAQQIPFDINEVQWDWQLMAEAGSSETKVGIFAVKSEVVSSVLEHFSRENLTVSCVQIAPMALYNYALYDFSDLGKSDNQATVILDIGAENSDLVVCTQSTVWQRSVPMGGNAFTRAVAEAFKLNFEKAEKLKRTAAMSKYARQVFQAMKPVFTDLASEIQRSLGFYSSSNPNTKISKVIALGGGTKMRGLLQYLRQTLQIPVEMPDSFKKLTISSDVSAAKFHESVCDFGIVYGLALQGLGLAKIESNLLPRSIARSMTWAGKTKYFTAAAAAVLLVSIMCFARTALDRVNYANNKQVRQSIDNVIKEAVQAGNKFEDEESKGLKYEAAIEKEFKPFAYREVVPLLLQTIISVLPNEKNNPEQKELYRAFADGDVKGVLNACKDRKERKQIFVTGISVYFTDDVAAAQFGAADFGRRGKSGPKPIQEEIVDAEGYLTASASGSKSKYSQKSSSQKGRKDSTAEGEKDAQTGPGFVVTIAGYSPYKNVGELMDPVGVEGDPNKWGVVTRLLHLDDVVGWENPFELYEKTRIEHFKLVTGEVDLESEMPAGIGLEEDINVDKTKKTEGVDVVLRDPMTREIISKVPDLDEKGKNKTDRSGKVIYKDNDHWFRLDVKFTWKDAPKEVAQAAVVSKKASKAKKTKGAGKSKKESKEIEL